MSILKFGKEVNIDDVTKIKEIIFLKFAVVWTLQTKEIEIIDI